MIGQDHRSRADRTCQRAPARFVHTADGSDALRGETFFDLPHIDLIHRYSSSGISRVNLPSLPLRNSSISTLAIRSRFTSARTIR